MLNKNKLFIFFTFLFLVISFTSSCFASTDWTFTGYNDVEYTIQSLPDKVNDYKYYILIDTTFGSSNINNSRKYLFLFNNDIEIEKSSSNTIKILNIDNFSNPTFYLYDSSGWTSRTINIGYTIGNVVGVIHSSSNLLNKKDELLNLLENGFFLTTPKAEGTLAQIMEVTPLEGVLQEIVEILPIILVTIAGLIGLRKALAMLLKVLHQS